MNRCHRTKVRTRAAELIIRFISLLVFVVTLVVTSSAQASADHPKKNERATATEQPALEVDESFAKAFSTGDRAVAGTFLDKDFTWTDKDGKTRNRAETLDDLTQFARGRTGYAEIHSYRYQKLALTFGSQEVSRFVRIWVRHSSGWLIFAELDTPIYRAIAPAANTPSAPPTAEDSAECDNPCHTLPYKPNSEAQEEVIKEWQQTKIDEWHPNAADWGTHVAEEFELINDRGALNKEQRVKIAYDNEAKGREVPGDPIVSMGMYQFGDAMVMISHHSAHSGKGPYYNLRVFIHRDGHWPLVWSQQTTVKAP
jgi:hypothetical protein